MKMVEQFCLFCGKELIKRQKKFCSPQCRGSFIRKNRADNYILGLKNHKARNYDLRLKFSENERESLQRKADFSNLNLSSFVRVVALNSSVRADIQKIIVL